MKVWIRSAAVGVALALAAGTLTGTAQPAAAAASWPATVLAAPVESLSRPGGLAAAGGRLFATDLLAGRVRAYDEKGALLATISSISQAGSIVASADGTRLYVAGENTIREIDTTTLKATATWTVASCVDDLTVTPTAVYYTYGCYGDSTGGLNHIDLTSGTVHDLAAPDVAGVSTSAANLAYAAGTLWMLEWDGTLTAWDQAGVTLSNERSTSIGPNGDYPISAHDSRLVVAGLDGAARIYSAADLSVIRTFAPPGVGIRSATFSADGTQLVAAVYGPYGFMAWDASTGSALFTTSAPGGAAQDSEPVGTPVVWNAAGTGVVALFQHAGSNTEHALVATGLQAPAAQTLTLTVKAPATYGAFTTFYLKGRPGAPVRLAVSSNSTTVVTTLRLSDTGRAIITRKLLVNFRVSAATPASLEFTPAAAAPQSFVVPSRMTVVSAAGYKTVNGVTYYHRVGDAKHRIRIEPVVGVRTVTVTAWKWSGGRWVKVTSKAFYTSSTGGLMITFVSVVRGARYRLTFSFAGDARNGRSSAVTKPFVIA